jgi:hypothetical protein
LARPELRLGFALWLAAKLRPPAEVRLAADVPRGAARWLDAEVLGAAEVRRCRGTCVIAGFAAACWARCAFSRLAIAA